MGEYHLIKNERMRETLQIILAVLGVIGVIIAVLSFFY